MPSKKKSRGPRKRGSTTNDDTSSSFRTTADQCHKKMAEMTKQDSTACLDSESKQLLLQLKTTPFITIEDTNRIVRKLAIVAGTDVDRNDNDPYGDGDQSISGAPGMAGEPQRQILRELFGDGAGLTPYLLRNGFSPFAMACGLGNPRAVERAVQATKQGSNERMELLERREGSMQFSPLILTVALSKAKGAVCSMTGANEEDMDHLGVVKILLQYGARPDAKELTGKTVVHYGAGVMATEDTLKMTDYVVEAAKSSAHFGKKVVLRNLKKVEYNGLTGNLGGFVADTGRRQVVLDENEKQLAILPKNIFSFGENEEEVCVYDSSRNLLNVRDRVGSISLHEVFMSHRVDVAEFLIERNVSIDVADASDTSVRKMAIMCNPTGVSTMNDIIRKYAVKTEKQEEKRCWECKMVSKDASACSRCKVAVYCSKECQKKHWSLHKSSCQLSSEEYSIQLSKPSVSQADFFTQSLSYANGARYYGGYQRPKGVGVDEQFWVKIQCNSEILYHLVYDKTRYCTFQIMPNTPGHLELYQKVKQQKAFNGLKSYFKAAFDAGGNCRVYPNTSTVKKW